MSMLEQMGESRQTGFLAIGDVEHSKEKSGIGSDSQPAGI